MKNFLLPISVLCCFLSTLSCYNVTGRPFCLILTIFVGICFLFSLFCTVSSMKKSNKNKNNE